MNIRCAFCQTPYTISRVAMLDAMQEVDAGKLSHYDAHCPRCRRATQIPRQRLEMAMPNWRDALKEFEKEMKQNPQQEALLPKPETTPVSETATASEASTVKKGSTKPKATARPTNEGAPKPAARQSTKNTASKGTTKKSK